MATNAPRTRPRKSSIHRSPGLFVLPTHSENFGVAVAEAPAHGIPALVTKEAPWQGLEIDDCGWWIGFGEATLADCLQEAMALSPNELAVRGNRGRARMQRDFSWEAIGRMTAQTYRWLVGGGPAPGSVHDD